MAIKINRVTNANVYVDGANLLGRANKVTLPAIKQLMEEHKGLGMVGKLKVPSGGIELDDATFEWASFYPEVIRKAASAQQAVQLQVRASIDEYAGAGLLGQTGLVVSMDGIFHDVPFGTFEQHKPTMQEMKFTPYYLKVVADDVSLVEVDLFNNIYKVADEDILSRFRTLIGG